MNPFSKLRFPKTSLTLFILAALSVLSLPVRFLLGASFALTDDAGFSGDFPQIFLPVLAIAVFFMLTAFVLWLFKRKDGIRFIDLLYPLGNVSCIGVMVVFHLMLFA